VDAGRLVAGVRLPAEGRDFFTWDPIHKRIPNRAWRRYGTDLTVSTTLGVLRRFRRKHPGAPRLAIGDLSRPHGGEFGMRFGHIGHLSHQNGRDIDVYYPRSDRIERAPRRLAQVDLRLSQTLVDLFVRAGAIKVFVGPRTRLRGPRGIVQPLRFHDTHVHVRFPAPR
jgi:murein endopeptidase